MKFREDVKEVQAHRRPTIHEIKRGYGCTHYRAFPVELWVTKHGEAKQWIKADDGLRYYRD